MTRRLWMGVLLVSALTADGKADFGLTSVYLGNPTSSVTLSPNLSGQSVYLYATGASPYVPATGFNLMSQIGDGLGGAAEPIFQGVDFSGLTIWSAHANTTTGGPDPSDGMYAVASVAFDTAGVHVDVSGTNASPQVIAKLTFDTTGILSGTFPIAFTNVVYPGFSPLDSTWILTGGDVVTARCRRWPDYRAGPAGAVVDRDGRIERADVRGLLVAPPSETSHGLV